MNWDLIIRNMGCQKFQENRHQVIIDSQDIEHAFNEIVLWAEALWWPKKCTMKFTRLGDLPIQKGTMYRQEVLLPFAPCWVTVVTDIIENRSISRRFLDGLLDGQETVGVLPYEEKIKVEYFMQYRIKGRINNILWKICFRNMHDYNLKLILTNLKQYLER